MSRFQQGSILKLKRKSGPDVWVFRWYDESSGTRTYKKRTLGTVAEMPQKRDAEKAVASFRANINTGVRVPETVSDLIAHYLKHELTADKKAYATIEATTIYLARHVGPKWGAKHLSDVRTVEVEEWLHSLEYAPATKSKIRNIMSALFNHAIRHEWINRNPISKVRASASRTTVRGQYVHLVSLHQQHERFAKVWDNNLRLQGFAEAFEQQQQTPRA